MVPLGYEPASVSSSPQGKGGGSKPPPRPSGWHEFVGALVSTGEENLWSSSGTKARAFLLKQGLREDTIRAVRLGYWPADGRFEGVYPDAPVRIPRGILIPWCDGQGVEALRVRRPVNAPRATHTGLPGEPNPVSVLVRGSRKDLYPGPEMIRTGKPLVMVDGEFDALLLGQWLEGLASVVVLGCAHRPRPRVLSSMLRATTWIEAGFGGDSAGDWLGASERYVSVRPPGEWGTNWVEAQQAGLDLKAWWLGEFDRLTPGFSRLRQPEPCRSDTVPVPMGSHHELTQRCDSSQDASSDPLVVGHSAGAVIDWGASDITTLKVMQSISAEHGDFDAIPPEVLEAIVGNEVDRDGVGRIPMEAEVDDDRWRCRNPCCLHKGPWWMSAHGVVNCLNCVTPAFPSLVIASGDATDAPTVEPDRSNQAVGGLWGGHIVSATSSLMTSSAVDVEPPT